jgi:hypothetical protein
METAIKWNVNKKPECITNYIVDKGGEGISLAWWDGINWIEMWGSKALNVYGWIDMPIY